MPVSLRLRLVFYVLSGARYLDREVRFFHHSITNSGLLLLMGHTGVSSPTRTSLSYAEEVSITDLFCPNVARSITAQLIQVVAFLHSQDTVYGGIL